VRVGLVSPYSWTVPSGVNEHVANLAVQLEEMGHQTWILAPTGNGSAVHPLWPIPSGHFVSVGGAMPFPSNGSKAYVNAYLFMLQRMARILKELRFDVLHVHEPCAPSVSGAASLRGVSPMVGTFHAALDRSLLYGMMAPFARKAIGNLAIKIVVSPAALAYPSSHFPGDYRVIPNGVAIERFKRARAGVKVAGRILFVGRAEPRKGLNILLQAFDMVRRELPQATLVLAGPRPDEIPRVFARVGDGPTWPMPGVSALGWVDHETKVDELTLAPVLCTPSTEGESFGIVLVEALAAGVPVVASDLPGYRSVLREGELGALVPPRDPEALAAALLRMLRDEPLRRRLAAAGAAAVEEYSWKRVAERVAACYEEAVERGHPNRRRGR
jgi:phosphatidylinositol alpha-mannosyltransferase